MEAIYALARNTRIQQVMKGNATRNAAVVGALLLVLRFYMSKKKRAPSYHIRDFSKVARKVGERASAENFEEFDVIVVGGGTSGCVIASRLSEDPSIRVLLLEAGRSGANLSFTKIPSAYSQYWLSKDEWGMRTEPQAGANNRKMYWPRAKLLGGCTNLNAMMFHYGAPSDYDEWAILQNGQPGAEEWSYKEFHRYFTKFEKYNPSQEFPDVDVTLRGAQGPVQVGYHGHCAKSTEAFIKASLNAGIVQSPDVNTHKGTLGVTKIMTYITPKGERATAESAYLPPKVLARPNLKVAIYARATRVLFEDVSGTPRAAGVEFMDKSGTKFIAKARKEVVMSAGAIHTPQILMLSGIGPADHLSSLGIKVVQDLNGVGSRLTDHAVIDLAYMDKSKTSLAYLKPQTLWQALKLTKALVQYKLTGKGPLTTNVGEAAGFVRSDDATLFPPHEFAPIADLTSGAGAPDIEVITSPMGYTEHGLGPRPYDGGPTIGLHAIVLRPKSHGTIRLRSSNPEDPPLIDPKYLSDADGHDLGVLVRGIRLLHKIAHTPPFAALVDPAGDGREDLQHALGAATDADVAAFARAHVDTLYHPACSARMAPRADGGVVDPFLRVHGVPNLRIADASVFPAIVAGHTTAPCYAIGEKAADLIRKDVGGGKD